MLSVKRWVSIVEEPEKGVIKAGHICIPLINECPPPHREININSGEQNKIIYSRRFKSRQCQQLLTGPPPLKILFEGPIPSKSGPKSKKKVAQASRLNGLSGITGGRAENPFFMLFTFWNQNCLGSTKMEILYHRKAPLLTADRAFFLESITESWIATHLHGDHRKGFPIML